MRQIVTELGNLYLMLASTNGITIFFLHEHYKVSLF
jgi:hypothetical protein